MIVGGVTKANRVTLVRRLSVLTLVLLVSGFSAIAALPVSAFSLQGMSPEVSAAQPAASSTPPSDSTTTTLPHLLYTPVVTKDRCHRDSDPSIFGVQMYGDTGNTSKYFSSLIGSQAKWVRVAVDWDSVEPVNTTPGNFNWSHTDRALSGATDSCVTLIATHEAQPEWAATYNKGPVDKVPLSELQQYFRALVERYDGDGYNDAPGSPVVNHWEMYNEPDAWIEINPGGWGAYPTEYAEMLQAIYPVIKESNPHAQVLFGGVLMDNYQEWNGVFVKTFVEDVLKAGAGNYFDIMNLHTYVGPFSRHYPELGIVEKTEEVRALMATYGLNKPVVITETGWHSNDTEYEIYRPETTDRINTPEIQARYVPQIYASGIQADLTTIIWWMLRDTGGDYQYDNGLVTNGSPPVRKPAFTAYVFADQMLASSGFIRKHTPAETGSEDAYVLEFYDPIKKRTVIVAWLLPVITEEVLTIKLDLPHATVYDPYGNVVADVSDAADGVADGRVTISGIGAQPRYIVRNY